MKKLIMSIVAAFTAVCVGCKSLPDAESMYKLGSVSGSTTAYVLEKQVKVDDATRNAIVEVMTQVQKYVPKTNETFNSAWTQIVNAYVDKLVASEKLTESQGARVKKDFDYITSLLDAYVEKKGIKPYQDLVDAFVDGFCIKFLEVFKPVNTVSASACSELDEFTKEFLESKMSK